MPNVRTPSGDQHFSYDAPGRAAAKATAKRQGVEVEYHAGGRVKKRKTKVRGTGVATKGLWARGPMA